MSIMHSVFHHLEKVLGVAIQDLTSPIRAILDGLDDVDDYLVHVSSPPPATEIHPEVCDHLLLNKLSSAVYSEKNLRYREYKKWVPLEASVHLVDQMEDFLGFEAVVYRVDVKKDSKYYMVFRGTDPTDIRNLLTDAVNALGLHSFSYRDALHRTTQVCKSFPGLILSGHSLGGGLAQYAALSLGLKAVTFNAADVACHLLKEIRDTNGTHLLNYRHINDPISAGNRLTGVLGMTCATGKQVILDGQETDLDAHALEASRHPLQTQCEGKR